MPGSLIGASQTFTPAGTSTYTITGANGTCTNNVTSTITVSSSPTVNVSGTAIICSGNSTTLTANGASTYTWLPGSLTGSVQVVSPASPTIYTVTGVTGSCAGISNYTITVNTTPTVVVSGISTLCSGNSTTLTAGGATTYTWNPGALTGSVQVLSPASTTTYVVTGVTGSCTGIRNYTVTVIPLPPVNASSSASLICAGQSNTLTASGATSYTWNPGSFTGNPVAVSPTTTTTYTVFGVSSGCSGTKTISVAVSPCTGITNLNIAGSVNVYPNPTPGLITVDFGNLYSGKIVVFNALGQELLNKNIHETETINLDLTSFAKGIYVIKLKAESGQEKTIKIIRD
jgi:hypothetical protein